MPWSLNVTMFCAVQLFEIVCFPQKIASAEQSDCPLEIASQSVTAF